MHTKTFWPGVVLLLMGGAACYGAPESTSDADFTHPATSDESSTFAASTAPTNPVGFTLNWQIDPNQCLQPFGGAASGGNTRVTSAPCTNATAQRWLWKNGTVVNAASNTCLDVASVALGSAVELTACSSTTQSWFVDTNGQFYKTLDGNRLLMGPTASGAALGSVFSLQTDAPATPARQWAWNTAPAAVTQADGFSIAFQVAPTSCLTATGTAVSMQPCGDLPNAQQWLFTNGLFQQRDQCLFASSTGSLSMATCDAKQPGQQWWLGASGDIVSMTSTSTTGILCLTDTNGALSLIQNTVTDVRLWIFGTQPLR